MENINEIRKETINSLNKYKNTNNYDENYVKLLISGLKLDFIDIRYFLNSIDNLIKYNIILANNLYEFLINNYKLDKYKIELSYLKNKLNEKRLYNDLTTKEQEVYDYCIKEGSLAYENSNYNKALELYQKGQNLTNHPIFDYYIGKMYFKLRKFDIANEYISKYELNGGEKEIHSLLYLWGNNEELTNKKIIKLDEKANKLIEFYDDLKKWKLPNFRKKIDNKKSLNDIDYKKYNGYKKIKITEDDFNSKTSLINEFDDYSFEEKLIIIRQLSNNGNIDLANDLLNQLSKTKLDGKARQQLTNIKKLLRRR